MRAGRRSTQEGGGTKFLMVSHASLRQLPTPNFVPAFTGVPNLTIAMFPDSLYVVQSDSHNPGAVKSLVWHRGAPPDLQAETSEEIKFDGGHPSGEVFPVPEEIDVLVDDSKKVGIKTNIEPTDSFAFSAVLPPNQLKIPIVPILLSLPELRTKVHGLQGQKSTLYTQTVGVIRQIPNNLPPRPLFAKEFIV